MNPVPIVIAKYGTREISTKDRLFIIDDEKNIYDSYEFFPFYSTNLKLKCASNSHLKDLKLTLNQLKNQQFIVMDMDSNMCRILKKACNKAGFEPEISAVCNDIECYENLIATGMGIGIGRENSKKLKNLNVTDFNESYTVFAYYRKEAYYGNVKSFVDYIKEYK